MEPARVSHLARRDRRCAILVASQVGGHSLQQGEHPEWAVDAVSSVEGWSCGQWTLRREHADTIQPRRLGLRPLAEFRFPRTGSPLALQKYSLCEAPTCPPEVALSDTISIDMSAMRHELRVGQYEHPHERLVARLLLPVGHSLVVIVQ